MAVAQRKAIPIPEELLKLFEKKYGKLPPEERNSILNAYPQYLQREGGSAEAAAKYAESIYMATVEALSVKRAAVPTKVEVEQFQLQKKASLPNLIDLRNALEELKAYKGEDPKEMEKLLRNVLKWFGQVLQADPRAAYRMPSQLHALKADFEIARSQIPELYDLREYINEAHKQLTEKHLISRKFTLEKLHGLFLTESSLSEEGRKTWTPKSWDRLALFVNPIGNSKEARTLRKSRNYAEHRRFKGDLAKVLIGAVQLAENDHLLKLIGKSPRREGEVLEAIYETLRYLAPLRTTYSRKGQIRGGMMGYLLSYFKTANPSLDGFKKMMENYVEKGRLKPLTVRDLLNVVDGRYGPLTTYWRYHLLKKAVEEWRPLPSIPIRRPLPIPLPLVKEIELDWTEPVPEIVRNRLVWTTELTDPKKMGPYADAYLWTLSTLDEETGILYVENPDELTRYKIVKGQTQYYDEERKRPVVAQQYYAYADTKKAYDRLGKKCVNVYKLGYDKETGNYNLTDEIVGRMIFENGRWRPDEQAFGFEGLKKIEFKTRKATVETILKVNLERMAQFASVRVVSEK